MSDSPTKVDRRYDVNIIYNKADNPYSENKDTELSLKCTKLLEKRLHDLGRTCYYNHKNSVPGQNKLSQLTYGVDSCRFTAVILTRGFMERRWNEHAKGQAFMMLLDKPNSFIPIAIGLRENEIPPELINTHALYFTDNWNEIENSEEWEKLKLIFEETQENPATSEGRKNTGENGGNLLLSNVGKSVTPDKEQHKWILQQCRTKILEEMDAIRVADKLIEKDHLDYYYLQEIQDIKNRTKRNRTLFNLIHDSGLMAYQDFKECLTLSGQQHLREALEAKEKAFADKGEIASQALEPATAAGDNKESSSTNSSRMEASQAESNQGAAFGLPSTDTEGLSQIRDEDRNGLEKVIPNVPGAGGTVRQGSTGVQSTHQISSHQALLSLDIDTPPSMSAPQLIIETEPNSRLPPTTQPSTVTNRQPAQLEEMRNSEIMSETQTSLKTIYNKDEQHVPAIATNIETSGNADMEDFLVTQRNVETASSIVLKQADTKAITSQISLSQDTDLVCDISPRNTESGLGSSPSDLNPLQRNSEIFPEESSAPGVINDRSHVHTAESDWREAEMQQTGGKECTGDSLEIRGEVDVAQLGKAEPSSNASQQTHTAGNLEVSGSQLRETEPGCNTSQQIHTAGNLEDKGSQLSVTEPGSNSSQQTHTHGNNEVSGSQLRETEPGSNSSQQTQRDGNHEVSGSQLREKEPGSNSSQQTHTAGNLEDNGSQLRESEPGSNSSQQISTDGKDEVNDSQPGETEPSSYTSQQAHTAGTGGQSILSSLFKSLCSNYARPELAFN